MQIFFRIFFEKVKKKFVFLQKISNTSVVVIEFTVGNFLSFYERRTISFEAKKISELKQNVIDSNGYKLLRSLVVYGANSSGKSNVIKAFDRMSSCVMQSIKLNDNDALDYSPFLLSAENENQPSFFEIIFLSGTQRFRYGFEYDLKKIVTEWLFAGKTHKTEKTLFIRTPEGIGVTEHFEEGKGKEEATNNNRLFLSLVAQLNGAIAKQVMGCFHGYDILSGVKHEGYGGFSLFMFEERLKGYDESLELFKKLQLGFKEIDIVYNSGDLSGNSKKVSLNTVHNVYDKQGKAVTTISWDRNDHESEGTRKVMDFSGPIFHTLLNGGLLIIDELDAKLHPLITMHIVNLFNSPTTNPNNAQLLFATHDTNLLSADIFRRDQIWFTEKDEVEQTDLYSLVDFNLPEGSTDSNMEKNYIRGRYGAIPFITNF